MTAGDAERSPLLRFALEGERVRKAVSVLEREGPRLAAALRRAVPFLARRSVPINLSQARAMPVTDIMDLLTPPVHVAHFVSKPGHAAGALFIDAGAAALILDGVLGGSGQVLPELNPAGLTGPQQALVGGVATNILRSFSMTLDASIGIALESRSAHAEELHVEGAPVACILDVGETDPVGHIALLLAREPLLTQSTATESPAPAADDPRIASVLDQVELTLVVELGRVSMTVGQLAAMKVGDTLRLDVPVDGLVTVRADGRPLMQGRPTSSGGRIAVKISPVEPSPPAHGHGA